jgi:predicted N-acetyltransferase YhbS
MTIRPVAPADAPEVGHTLYHAFCGIADQHNFPHDFPSAEVAAQMAQMCIHNPDLEGFVAQSDDGEFLGSNFLWRQNAILGVGPISVNPQAQAKGVGRALMRAVIEAGCDAPGIRLVQDAFNTASLSLYASEGFEVVEPLVLVQGTPISQTITPGTEVRPLEANDYGPCNELCKRVHGFSRGAELQQLAAMFPA